MIRRKCCNIQPYNDVEILRINLKIKSYYKILSEDFPDFLNEYINTPDMLKQAKISVSCGTIYSKMYNQMWYSSLDHSIAVALIIWHFTKDKKQTFLEPISSHRCLFGLGK